jgi:hypothetical protein
MRHPTVLSVESHLSIVTVANDANCWKAENSVFILFGGCSVLTVEKSIGNFLTVWLPISSIPQK